MHYSAIHILLISLLIKPQDWRKVATTTVQIRGAAFIQDTFGHFSFPQAYSSFRELFQKIRICRVCIFVSILSHLYSAVEAYMKNSACSWGLRHFPAGSCNNTVQLCRARRIPFLACTSSSWFWKQMPIMKKRGLDFGMKIINNGPEKTYIQLYRTVEYVLFN